MLEPTPRRKGRTYFECGQCGHYHAVDLDPNIDCRDDAHRFTFDQLDAKHGAEKWEEITLAEQLESDAAS